MCSFFHHLFSTFSSLLRRTFHFFQFLVKFTLVPYPHQSASPTLYGNAREKNPKTLESFPTDKRAWVKNAKQNSNEARTTSRASLKTASRMTFKYFMMTAKECLCNFEVQNGNEKGRTCQTIFGGGNTNKMARMRKILRNFQKRENIWYSIWIKKQYAPEVFRIRETWNWLMFSQRQEWYVKMFNERTFQVKHKKKSPDCFSSLQTNF